MGISSLQVCRYMGIGFYKTAWLMCNKIRVALGNVEFKKLIGYVEIDEAYVGGKAKNKHKGKGRTRGLRGHWRNGQGYCGRSRAAQGERGRSRH